MNKTTKVILFVIIVVAIVIGMRVVLSTTAKPSKYEAFATCMKDAGATFYGAFWCPHCQAQEKEFEMSRQALENIGLYTECSTADAKGQTQICIDKEIKSYPTWVFADGTSVSGEQTLAYLSEKTNCPLPTEATE